MSTKQTLIFLPKSISSQASFEAGAQSGLNVSIQYFRSTVIFGAIASNYSELRSIKQDSLVIALTPGKDMCSNITRKDAITIIHNFSRGLDICYSDKLNFHIHRRITAYNIDLEIIFIKNNGFIDIG